MPIGGKDAFLSKVTFSRESKWYSKTIEERALEHAKKSGICHYTEMLKDRFHPFGVEREFYKITS